MNRLRPPTVLSREPGVTRA
ncbi:hypothetical protein YPPY58_4281, partial [Yersinia pestis PY-58]